MQIIQHLPTFVGSSGRITAGLTHGRLFMKNTILIPPVPVLRCSAPVPVIARCGSSSINIIIIDYSYCIDKTQTQNPPRCCMRYIIYYTPAAVQYFIITRAYYSAFLRYLYLEILNRCMLVQY
jgi:hypothetical protein